METNENHLNEEALERWRARHPPGAMHPQEQLGLWVEGNSTHNSLIWVDCVDEAGVTLYMMRMEGGECCPDFSCCTPELLQPLAVRQAFVAASGSERSKLLSVFMGAMLEKSDLSEVVHIAGGDPNPS